MCEKKSEDTPTNALKEMIEKRGEISGMAQKSSNVIRIMMSLLASRALDVSNSMAALHAVNDLYDGDTEEAMKSRRNEYVKQYLLAVKSFKSLERKIHDDVAPTFFDNVAVLFPDEIFTLFRDEMLVYKERELGLPVDPSEVPSLDEMRAFFNVFPEESLRSSINDSFSPLTGSDED